MRTKKAIFNAIIGIITYIISFLPLFIVRKVFLDVLGSELLGLNSLYSNIISYLSIVEMGIGSAIIFSLYKPFAEKDYIKVKGYINYYSRFYKFVGFFILIVGIILTPFLNIFIKDNINIKQAQVFFILFLMNTFISYLFSYKQCILNVAQEGYKASLATTISKLVIAILQVLFLKLYGSLYSYIIIQIIINLIYYNLVNYYIDKKFKHIIDIKGKIEKKEKDDLKMNIKALFMHKIGSVVVLGTDSLVISAFISLSVVAKYNSYNMIFTALQGVISSGMNAITPSIGNLLVEGDSSKAYKVHKKIFFANFWIVSFVIIVLLNTINQFIELWLDGSQILDNFTVYIILINLYFQLMRSSVERFKEGSGNYYQDRYASLFEAVINLFFSLLLVNKIGLPGVFIGTLISNLTVIFWTKPKITYKYVFNRPLIDYFKMYFKFLSIGTVPLILTHYLTTNIRNINSFYAFAINILINIITINIFYLIVFWKTSEFKYFKNLIFSSILKYKPNRE